MDETCETTYLSSFKISFVFGGVKGGKASLFTSLFLVILPPRFLRCYFFLPSSVPIFLHPLHEKESQTNASSHSPPLSLLFSSVLYVLVSYCVLYFCNIPAPPLFLSFFLSF